VNLIPQLVCPVVVSRRCFLPLADTQTAFFEAGTVRDNGRYHLNGRRLRSRVTALNVCSVVRSATEPAFGSMPNCRAKEAPS